jgi:hypothetical protein
MSTSVYVYLLCIIMTRVVFDLEHVTDQGYFIKVKFH